MSKKNNHGGPITRHCDNCNEDKVVIGKSKRRLKCRKCKSILR